MYHSDLTHALLSPHNAALVVHHGFCTMACTAQYWCCGMQSVALEDACCRGTLLFGRIIS